MNWNNDKLNEIQAIENNLINSINSGSSSKLFTTFIHSTVEYNNPKTNDETVLNYKPIDKFVMPKPRAYKHHFIRPNCMEQITNDMVKLIQSGHNINVACLLVGYNYNVLRPRFTNEHKAKFKEARKIKYSNNEC